MRGKGVVDVLVSEPLGITPACAGKSLWSPLLLILAEDHPRVCGEKDLELYRIMTTKGSPPRVRGKAIHHQHRHSPGRITPAYAGKSSRAKMELSRNQDHPRVCGEKLSTTSTDIHPAGSPSRVRGKADFPVRCREHSRITPACVGKRRKPCRRHAANRDHPRVCGEKATCCSMEQSR